MIRSQKAIDLLTEAKNQIAIAENMYAYTSSVNNNFKVYLSCMLHIRNALILSARANLEHEAYFKRVMFIPENEKLLLKMFMDKFDTDFRISLIDKKNIKELNYIYEVYKSKETGMKRGDSYLVISSNFEMVSLNKEQINNYQSTVRTLVKRTEEKINKSSIKNF